MKLNNTLLTFLLSFTIITTINVHVVFAQNKPINPELPIIPGKQFPINNYGAVSDGVTDNTTFIQSTINAALNAGGGKVIIPKGEYLCGPLQFGSNLNLHLDSGAILKMLPIDKYPGGTKNGNNFISGADLHDIAISGKGIIDGQGSPWWKFAKTEGAKRPRMITFKNCNRILIEQVKLVNSPMFHIAIGGKTTNVTVQDVVVRAPSSKDPVNPSHNTDACDVTGSTILIKNCDISVGDDDYTCGGGTSDVLITNCTYGNGHGVSIGSGTKNGVKNFTVENCTFTNTDCGIRIKTDRDRGGVVENITYRNLQMNNVGFPILIYEAYNAKEKAFRNLENITPEVAATYPSASITDKTPYYKNIMFQHINATTVSGKRAGLIWGLPEAAVSNITLQDVNITADKAFGIFFANNVTLTNCTINTKEGKNKVAHTNSTITIDGEVVH